MSRATITKIIKETPSAISVVLKPDEDLTFKPGQFITLVFEIDGKKVKRSYSFSSIPGEPWRITIKKVKNGLVSTHLHEVIREGDAVEFQGPEGAFFLNTSPSIAKHIFIGAGSGITPLRSMMKSALDSNKRVTLFYGSKTEKETIFLDEFRNWAETHDDFDLRLYISRPGLKASLFSSKRYQKGRMTVQAIDDWCIKEGHSKENTAFYICGPGEMNDEYKKELLELGVAEDQIHQEYFTSGVDEEEAVAGSSIAEITLSGKTIELEIPKSTTILQALIDAGYDPPYSCMSGTCCTCMAQKVEGEVRMVRNDALSKSEVKKGFILTCQSKILTDTVKVNYDLD